MGRLYLEDFAVGQTFGSGACGREGTHTEFAAEFIRSPST